ncbi:MAG TPA: TolC family protein [Thermoanaerobaculia bacterium]|jgi:outer membrane protein TolC|nr:TolC family protein [Thermoanaerobaculia bacterium]
MPKLVVTSLLMLFAGCIAYQPRPASIESNAKGLLTRSLDSEIMRGAIAAQEPSAAGNWPPQRWTASQLGIAALVLHPDLDVARANLTAARAAIRIAAERPNPSVSVGVERKSGSGPVSPWVTSLTLTLPIETAGKRGARVREATALSNEAAANVDQAIWAVRNGVARAAVDLARAEALHAARIRERVLREEIVAIHTRRLEAGDEATPEVARARAEERSAAAMALADAARIETARDTLAGAIGIPRTALPRDIDLQQRDVTRSSASDATLYELALTARPDVLAALARYDAADAAYRLEVQRQYPDLNLFPGLGWDQSAFKWTIGAAAELPIFNRHEGPIARADAERERAAMELVALQARILSAVDTARTQERNARERLAAATRVAEARESLLASGRKQFSAGEIDRLVLRLQEVESAAAEADRVDARFDIHAALVELEAAVEQPLGGNR